MFEAKMSASADRRGAHSIARSSGKALSGQELKENRQMVVLEGLQVVQPVKNQRPFKRP
jgi:hypothetical protein